MTKSTQLLNQTSFEFPTSILTLPPAQNIPAPPTLPLDGGPWKRKKMKGTYKHQPVKMSQISSEIVFLSWRLTFRYFQLEKAKRQWRKTTCVKLHHEPVDVQVNSCLLFCLTKLHVSLQAIQTLCEMQYLLLSYTQPALYLYPPLICLLRSNSSSSSRGVHLQDSSNSLTHLLLQVLLVLHQLCKGSVIRNHHQPTHSVTDLLST